jgi:alpha-amylase/alpha-mannosidase (GH57 family)
MECLVCIHCHFYQPPRENPWLEAVEVQDSASPHHDWNERINHECYLPNGASRILDGQSRITKIVNNYSRISFNFGPTLLSWMEEKNPGAYERILKGDRESQQFFPGHGSALAQAYNHTILPLANSRDKRTQILWGIADFRHRFGRDPEGIWLPETAVDVETLELLSDAGIKFTILAPHQAGKLRARRDSPWIDLHGQGIDSRRAYGCSLPSGGTIGIFFYDGAVSRAVAFDKLLFCGENFARRLLGRFDPDGEEGQLVHIATDGETYGHHHVHGDMALAYALDYIERNKLARITNYGEYFAEHPPSQEVEILERTAWSCMHGVGRWESNCGCNSMTNGHWTQAWRRPLRDALDWLRDELAGIYEARTGELLLDPWSARDEYVTVVADRSSTNVDSFLAKHAARKLSAEEELRVLRLMEMQRHLMLMYTSCGWFFDEPTGPETVQVLQYAGRAVQLSEELFGDQREEQFLKLLEKVHSNIPEFGNGRSIYERFVRPAMLDLFGVAAHYAISSLFDGYDRWDSVYCYRVDLQEVNVFESGKAKLAIGVSEIISRITRARLKFSFAALYFGGHELRAAIGPCQDDNAFAEFTEDAVQAFSAGDLSDCLKIIERYFRRATYSLRSLFRDERQRIVTQLVDSTLFDVDQVYGQVYEQQAGLVSFLGSLSMPLPPILRASAEFVLSNAVRRCLDSPEIALDSVRQLLDAARRQGITLADSSLGAAFRQKLEVLLNHWAKDPLNLKSLEKLDGLVSLAGSPPFDVDLWQPQTMYYEQLKMILSTKTSSMSEPWLGRFRGLGSRLGIAVPESFCFVTPPSPKEKISVGTFALPESRITRPELGL